MYPNTIGFFLELISFDSGLLVCVLSDFQITSLDHLYYDKFTQRISDSGFVFCLGRGHFDVD